MTVTGTHRRLQPTCEDASDEEIEGPYSDNRASANVAIKRSKSSDLDKTVADKKSNDGSDSGYSSKAGSSDKMSTASLNKGGDLKIDTATPIDRKPRPYSYAPTHHESTRPSTSPGKKPERDAMARYPPARFQHPPGMCWVCDQYGYHFDIEKEMQRPATAAPTQRSHKVAESPAPKARSKEESDARPSTSRRSSSTSKKSSRQRPVSMYGAPGTFQFPPPMDYSHPTVAAHGWQTPPPGVPTFPQYQYAYSPATPMSATYSQQPNFFDMHAMQYSNPPEPFYANPGYDDYDGPALLKPAKKTDSRATSRETRQRAATEKSKLTAEEARRSMPPPPKPGQARPVIRKAPTEYPTMPAHRRQSVFDDDDDEEEVQAVIARTRHTSTSRPPSSFKAPPGAEIYGRPRPRKSSSYSTPSGTVQIASTHREMPRRSTDPLDQKLAEAEDYVLKMTTKQREADREAYLKSKKQRAVEIEDGAHPRTKKGPEFDEYTFKPKVAMNPSLTTEALKKFELRNSSGASDAGSVRSMHSNSRDSAAGRTRASTNYTSGSRMTNITMDNGLTLSIPADLGDTPLHIVLGNMTFSVNSAREEEPAARELKRIEKAPSEISHSSHRSLTSGSAVSVPKGREEQQNAAREKQSGKSSKRSSRAPSTSRRREEVPSIDYSLLDESYYYGAGS